MSFIYINLICIYVCVRYISGPPEILIYYLLIWSNIINMHILNTYYV